MKANPRLHAELNLRTLDTTPGDRETLCSSILKIAPQSPLYAEPSIQDGVAKVGKTFDAFNLARAAYEAHRKEGAILLAALTAATNNNNSSLVILKALAESFARTPDDLTSLAYKPRSKSPPEPLLPVDSIDVRSGRRASGRVTVSAHETGKTKWHYAAQSSPNPFGPTTWTDLIGDGKSRKLHGESQTSLWVRFARRRGSNQTDWSTPILITFP